MPGTKVPPDGESPAPQARGGRPWQPQLVTSLPANLAQAASQNTSA